MTQRGEEDDPGGVTSRPPATSDRGETGDEPPPELNRMFGGSLKQAAPMIDAAYGVVGAILGLGLIGWLFDKWMGSAPKGLVTGVLVGVAVGLYGLARVTLGKRR